MCSHLHRAPELDLLRADLEHPADFSSPEMCVTPYRNCWRYNNHLSMRSDGGVFLTPKTVTNNGLWPVQSSNSIQYR